MLRHHSKAVETALRLLDFALLATAWPIAHLVLFGTALPPALARDPFVPVPLHVVAFVIWVASTSMFELYGARRRDHVAAEISIIARSLALVALGTLAASSFWRGEVSRRALIALFAVVGLGLLSSFRLVLRGLAHAVRRRGFNTRYFAVVGQGDHAEEIVARIASHPEWGYTFLGFVRDGQAVPVSCDLPVLGDTADLNEILRQHVVDEIFFAVAHHRLTHVEPAVKLCQEMGVAVRISLGSFGDGIAPMELVETDGWPMLAFKTGASSELGQAAKRLFDVITSATMLLLLAPVFGLVALAIRADSPGPVFFRQRRVGLNGREFTFFKFRSMRIGAEDELAKLRAMNEMDGPVFKMRADPRVTRIGRFIRKSSIDELPQFWNVLRGEMSIVGPRPPIPAEVRQYQRWQRRRLSVKPGITCTWQVSGRNDVSFDQWMKLDLEYIDRWSFWCDIGICFRTIPAVLFARGAR